MKKQVFMVTVNIAVQADSVEDTNDFMTALLTERLMNDEGTIIDWQYASKNGSQIEPESLGEHVIEEITEFEIFNKVNESAADRWVANQDLPQD